MFADRFRRIDAPDEGAAHGEGSRPRRPGEARGGYHLEGDTGGRGADRSATGALGGFSPAATGGFVSGNDQERVRIGSWIVRDWPEKPCGPVSQAAAVSGSAFRLPPAGPTATAGSAQASARADFGLGPTPPTAHGCGDETGAVGPAGTPERDARTGSKVGPFALRGFFPGPITLDASRPNPTGRRGRHCECATADLAAQLRSGPRRNEGVLPTAKPGGE